MSFDYRRSTNPPPPRDFYVGVDLGQKRDYTVVAVIEKKDRQFTLVHLKEFPLGTEYTAVIDYLKMVADEFHDVRLCYIDQTGIGEFFVENAAKRGIKNVTGIVLTMPTKQDIMVCLKEVMEEKRLHIPRDDDLMNEMSGQMAELTSTGKTKFYHRSGTHDDRLWALALAVYAARHDVERYHPVAALGRNPNTLMPNLPRKLFRPGSAGYSSIPGAPVGMVNYGPSRCMSCGGVITSGPHLCNIPRG